MDNDVIDDVFRKNKKLPGTKYIFLVIWISLLIFSLLLKINHWPGGHTLLLVSTAGLSGYSFFYLVIFKFKSILFIILSSCTLAWIIYIFYGFQFRNGHPFNLRGLLLFGLIFSIVLLTNYLIYRKRIKNLNF